MYTDKVLILRWHHTGITWEPGIRLKSFDMIDIRSVATEYRDSFTGKLPRIINMPLVVLLICENQLSRHLGKKMS